MGCIQDSLTLRDSHLANTEPDQEGEEISVEHGGCMSVVGWMHPSPALPHAEWSRQPESVGSSFQRGSDSRVWTPLIKPTTN